MCKILSWLIEYILNQRTANYGRISNSIEISLLGRAPGPEQAANHHLNQCWHRSATRTSLSLRHRRLLSSLVDGNGLLIPHVNTLRPRQDGSRLPDDIFKCIFFNKNVLLLVKISLKFVPKGSINNIPALIQIMAWRRPGDKPLSEPMMVSLPTHICVIRPQWVKYNGYICPGNARIHNNYGYGVDLFLPEISFALS